MLLKRKLPKKCVFLFHIILCSLYLLDLQSKITNITLKSKTTTIMSNEILLYQSNELTERIEVRLVNETVWLNRQ